MSRLPIDTAEIRALAEILADTGLTEIEISDGDSRIRVARSPAPIAGPLQATSPPPVSMSLGRANAGLQHCWLHLWACRSLHTTCSAISITQ